MSPDWLGTIASGVTAGGGIVMFFRWRDRWAIHHNNDMIRNQKLDQLLTNKKLDKLLTAVTPDGGQSDNLSDTTNRIEARQIVIEQNENDMVANQDHMVANQEEAERRQETLSKELSSHIGWAEATVHEIDRRIEIVENLKGHTHDS